MINRPTLSFYIEYKLVIKSTGEVLSNHQVRANGIKELKKAMRYWEGVVKKFHGNKTKVVWGDTFQVSKIKL